MTDLERGPSSDGESAICASSLNKPSSQEGLNAGERRAQLRALLHGINAKIGMRDPNWWDVAAEIVNEEIEALARHPSFNDAIEAAAKIVDEPLNGIEINRFIADGKVMTDRYGRELFITKENVEHILAAISSAIRSLKLPDYRGGEKIDSTKTAESGHSPSTLNAETE